MPAVVVMLHSFLILSKKQWEGGGGREEIGDEERKRSCRILSDVRMHEHTCIAEHQQACRVRQHDETTCSLNSLCSVRAAEVVCMYLCGRCARKHTVTLCG